MLKKADWLSGTYTPDMLTAYLVHTDVAPASAIRFDDFPSSSTASSQERTTSVGHNEFEVYEVYRADVHPGNLLPPNGGSKSILNSIHHMALYAQKSNLHSVPTGARTNAPHSKIHHTGKQ